MANGLVKKEEWCVKLDKKEKSIQHDDDSTKKLIQTIGQGKLSSRLLEDIGSRERFAQIEAQQLAVESVLTQAGFQKYQARGFMFGNNEPTRVFREFVEQFGFERDQHNDERREAKIKLDQVIYDGLANDPAAQEQFMFEREQYFTERSKDERVGEVALYDQIQR